MFERVASVESRNLSRWTFVPWVFWIAMTLAIEIRWTDRPGAWDLAGVVFFVTLVATYLLNREWQLLDLLCKFLSKGWARTFLVFGWLICVILRFVDPNQPTLYGIAIARIAITSGLALWLWIHLVFVGVYGVTSILERDCKGVRFPRWLCIAWALWAMATIMFEFGWPRVTTAWLLGLICFGVLEAIGIRSCGTWSRWMWKTLDSHSRSVLRIVRYVVMVAWVFAISFRLTVLDSGIRPERVDPWIRGSLVMAILGFSLHVLHGWKKSSSDAE